MPHRRVALLLGPLLLAACAAATPSTPAPGSPGASAPPSHEPPVGEIDHATGPTDVVLRFEEGGGFVPLGYLVTQAPTFTFYGDGTVVFRNQFAEPTPPGPVIRDTPFRAARLTEGQVQSLLSFALAEGGLGVARESYTHGGIADAPTAIFTVDAGGVTKVVSVYALGIEGPDVPDGPARAAFARLADRLRDFDAGGDTVPYQPDRYRGVLYDAFGGGAPVPWPWPDIAPTDFVAASDPDVPSSGFPSRTLTAAEVDALGLDDVAGGIQGLILEAPDGATTYSLALRPLLPDEAS
jgi:hypothetical protein